MITIWTKDLTDQDQIKKFNQLVQESPVLDRLNEILTEMKKENERVELTKEAYDSPNWSHKQAHRNGYVAALNTMLFLTNPDQRKLNDRPIQPERPTGKPRSNEGLFGRFTW